MEQARALLRRDHRHALRRVRLILFLRTLSGDHTLDTPAVVLCGHLSREPSNRYSSALSQKLQEALDVFFFFSVLKSFKVFSLLYGVACSRVYVAYL